MIPAEERVEDFRPGWDVWLRVRKLPGSKNEHEPMTIEGRFMGTYDSPSRGRSIQVYSAEGGMQVIPVARIVKARRVLGKLDDRRRAKAKTYA